MGYMDRETVPELDALTRELEADDSVRAVVFTGGVPGVFVRHYSVDELEALSIQLRQAGVKVDTAQPLPERDLDHVFRRLETMGKPVIAALNGTAMGGGFELSLACDIRIAEAGDYAFGLPEINLGILPGAGGTQKLSRLIGTARTLEMTLRGRTASPEEALALGMVHELMPAGGAPSPSRTRSPASRPRLSRTSSGSCGAPSRLRWMRAWRWSGRSFSTCSSPTRRLRSCTG